MPSALLTQTHSFFSLSNGLSFLNLATYFIDIILDLKNSTKIVQPMSMPLTNLRYRQRRKGSEKERKKKSSRRKKVGKGNNDNCCHY